MHSHHRPSRRPESTEQRRSGAVTFKAPGRRFNNFNGLPLAAIPYHVLKFAQGYVVDDALVAALDAEVARRAPRGAR